MELAELVDPAHTAVLTMELQRGVVGDLAVMRQLSEEVAARGVVEAVARLLDGARAAGARVVHCTVSHRADGVGTPRNTPMLRALAGRGGGLLDGSTAAQLIPSLGPAATDFVEQRNHGMSPFAGTSLDGTLRALGTRTVVATGVSLNIGVLGLVIEAVNHGYEAVIPTDAVAGIPRSYGEAVLDNTLRHVATLTDVDEIIATWRDHR